MNDDSNVIDVEAVEIEDSDNLPAVVETGGTHGAVPPIEGRDWSTYSRPERRCTAHSSRTGERCKNVAIKGGKVCRYHGGNAPHVIANARARLQNAADLMARELLGIALTADTESVKLAAIRDALDRAGLKPPAEVVLSQGETKPYETVFDSIGGDPQAAGFGSAASEDDISAGVDASPAPAYDPSADSVQAGAGAGVSECGTRGYGDAGYLADEYAQPSSNTEPPREADRQVFDRDGQAQARHDAPSRRTPARRELHITGMAAILIANEANKAAGVFDEQRAIESPHRRYLRP